MCIKALCGPFPGPAALGHCLRATKCFGRLDKRIPAARQPPPPRPPYPCPPRRLQSCPTRTAAMWCSSACPAAQPTIGCAPFAPMRSACSGPASGAAARCAWRQQLLGGHNLCRGVPLFFPACPGRPFPCLQLLPHSLNATCLPACSPPASCPPLMTPTAATAPTPQREPRLPRACLAPGPAFSRLCAACRACTLARVQPSDPCACIVALLPSRASACLQGVGGC